MCNLVNKELERTWNRAVVSYCVHSTGICVQEKRRNHKPLNLDGVRVGTLLAGAQSEML